MGFYVNGRPQGPARDEVPKDRPGPKRGKSDIFFSFFSFFSKNDQKWSKQKSTMSFFKNKKIKAALSGKVGIKKSKSHKITYFVLI